MSMKMLLAAMVIFSIPTVGHASKSPSAKLCAIMKDALSGQQNPQALCNKYSGSFCASISSMGQAVCAANGEPFCTTYASESEAYCEAGDGKFCSSVTTLAGGICAILDEPFCSSEKDEMKWKKKLAEACFW